MDVLRSQDVNTVRENTKIALNFMDEVLGKLRDETDKSEEYR